MILLLSEAAREPCQRSERIPLVLFGLLFGRKIRQLELCTRQPSYAWVKSSLSNMLCALSPTKERCRESGQTGLVGPDWAGCVREAPGK
jgi:hypothetical protein